MRYKYKSISNDGRESQGLYVGDNEAGLIAMLKDKRELVISIERDIQSEAQIEIFKKKVKKKDLALFCRQFYTMISAGLGIVPCLEILVAQTENKSFKNAIADTYEEVQKGSTLSESMTLHKNVFPTILISMVEAGEVSGNLDTIMLRMAEHFEKENKTENKVKSALVYPAVLAFVSVAVVVFMLVFILPTFTSMFEGSGTELPALTQMLIDLSHSMQTYWYIYLAVVIAIVFGISMYMKTEEGKRFFDSLKLRLPVVKKTSAMLATSRFTRTLSTLLSSGIPLIQAMEVVARVVNNSIIEERLLSGIESIRKGVSLSRTVKDVGIFPPMVESMIRIGEESGSLDDMLYKTADFYDEEAEASIQRLTSMIEPLMIVVMGFSIGFIVIAMYLPMFDMVNTVQ
ncbi:MAG: type II secretion system F family protein [Sedimentibacter saalensis]|uniref:type II secretion system F family protein n=1 Tax=Sedimentibacter saalensis TaxID=130788 RepID=UPI002B202E68|nr:type II secretion system F family protein [Sedimentibacter saalensis]MEA5095475.1 type II secretion system F family protein [Sedimentibacter saalensis]